ncbi:TonB-dependent siderophore receptor [Sandarakinorhabdus sp. DWP1-3-1]|uniref:TonB-dependent siderophore receptor n=1 Tax=Sandarakinorhabdus sp. DWP1-3-1 TaxID=2804627 RepID=UPI003CF2AE98
MTLRYVAAALALIGPATPASANDTAADDASVIIVTGERERGYRAEAQSVALFGARPVLDTPFSVSSFSIELLQDQQVRTLFDVAKNDPSVVATDAATGFYDSVAIRGFTLSNSSGYYREGLLYQNQAQSPFENKAAVEILKGVAGLRFGFASPGGIVNYVMKRPTSAPYRFVDVFGDSNGGIGAHVDIGGPIGDTLGFRFNGVLARDALFVDDVAGPRRMASLFLAWQAAPNLTVELEGEYQFRELEQNATISLDSFQPGLTRDQIRGLLDRYDRRTYLGQSWTTYPTSNLIGSARVKWQFAPDWSLRAGIQKMNLVRDQNATYIAFQSIDAAGNFDSELYYQPDQRRDPLTAELAIEGKFATGPINHDVVIGAYHLANRLTFPQFGFYDVIGRSNLFNPVRIADPMVTSDPSFTGVRERQWSLYATDFVALTDRLTVLVGGRYTRPKFETFFNPDQSRDSLYEKDVFTPVGAVIYKPAPSVSIYATYAEGFEQGGTAPLGTANANQQLPPITSRQYEIGAKAELFAGATLAAAVFDIDRSLERIDDSNRYVQDGRQRHRGFELTLAGQLTRDLRVVGGLQYLDARIRETDNLALLGKRPSNVPEWQGNVFVDYRLPLQADLAVNGGVYLSSSKFADEINSFAVDGFARLDLGARYAFDIGNARATLRLVVENVFDSNYFTGVGFGAFQFAAPRTARLSLSTVL